MKTQSPPSYEVYGTNEDALFTLKVHRGEGMVLLAMNWKKGKPSTDFVGFAIEYKEPKGDRFYPLKNRISFPGSKKKDEPNTLSSRLSPFQKFRWVHFPRNADLKGEFLYKVTPVFMNKAGELMYGEEQQAAIELFYETYPNKLNVTFTRGFVSSQAFVDYYGYDSVKEILPAKADEGLDFEPTHPKAEEALAWMGFEARREINKLLDDAYDDKKAKVYVVAYDLGVPDVVERLEKLGKRLKIIIDNSGTHGGAKSAETQAAKRLIASAGKDNVLRQKMKKLQHNKTIIVDGPKIKAAVGGSTNFSWRGFFVQANNAIILHDKDAIQPFLEAFQNYWTNTKTPAKFGNTASAKWTDLGFKDIKAKVSFSPHSSQNELLGKIASDVDSTKSSLLFSLAFLYQTEGPLKDAVSKASKDENIFVYGISDKSVGGLDVQKPDGNAPVVFPSALIKKGLPAPFKAEPTGGSGNRMHHKFVVIDFDKPGGRVYMGSYNFSDPADTSNGENLFLIQDKRIVTSYAIEAVRLFDHYHFRIEQQKAKSAKKNLELALPPAQGKKPWWDEDFTVARKIKDRILFSK